MEVINLEKERILKAIEDQTDLNRTNSNISEAFDEAVEQAKMYNFLELQKAEIFKQRGIHPFTCYNSVCKDNSGENTCNLKEKCHGCIFQMTSPPPNSFSYDTEMPSHKEALDILEKHGLIKGELERIRKENQKYQNSKPETQKGRGNTEITGITFLQLEEMVSECFNIFKDVEIDEIAFYQCLCVEIEKGMGIYPNIRLRPL
jgi:hypothetical protein